jgi:hypothetical protein
MPFQSEETYYWTWKVWEQRFQALKDYKEKHRHCNVSDRDPRYRNLGIWLSDQKTRRWNGKLSPHLIGRLTELGVDFGKKAERYERIWNEKYERLCEYRERHGNCEVAQHEDPELALWVTGQKALFKKTTLRADRQKKLENLGLALGPSSLRSKDKEIQASEKKFQDMYDQLVVYHKKRGHTKVPVSFVVGKERHSLGRWVRVQRTLHAQGILRPDHKALLDKLDFVWELNNGKSQPTTANRKPQKRRRSLVSDASAGHKRKRPSLVTDSSSHTAIAEDVPGDESTDTEIDEPKRNHVKRPIVEPEAGRFSGSVTRKKVKKNLDETVDLTRDVTADETLLDPYPDEVKGLRSNNCSGKGPSISRRVSNYGESSNLMAQAAKDAQMDLRNQPGKPEAVVPVGTLVMKYFGDDGWWLGEVASNDGNYRIVYEDEDEEVYSLDSESIPWMVDAARDVAADEILLDPDADEETMSNASKMVLAKHCPAGERPLSCSTVSDSDASHSERQSYSGNPTEGKNANA